MIITIKQIEIVQIPESKNGLNSYWIEFESSLVTGQALLYSQAFPEVLLAGKQISAEISQHDIEDFHLLAEPNQLAEGKLIPLGTPCDYEVTGRIAILYDDVFFADVESGRCSFAIAFDKINPITVKEGDWVAFKVKGLELWDEHF